MKKETVYHFSYGICKVNGIVEKTFGNAKEKAKFVHLSSMYTVDADAFVPFDTYEERTREVTSKEDMQKLLEVLPSIFDKQNANFRTRIQDFDREIKKGDIRVNFGIMASLYDNYAKSKYLSVQESKVYTTVRFLLFTEVAAVLDVSIEEAESLIENVLSTRESAKEE